MDKQRKAHRGGNIDFYFRVREGRRENGVTEKTWALLIICITVIFIASIVVDCIKSVKRVNRRMENTERQIKTTEQKEDNHE